MNPSRLAHLNPNIADNKIKKWFVQLHLCGVATFFLIFENPNNQHVV